MKDVSFGANYENLGDLIGGFIRLIDRGPITLLALLCGFERSKQGDRADRQYRSLKIDFNYNRRQVYLLALLLEQRERTYSINP